MQGVRERKSRQRAREGACEGQLQLRGREMTCRDGYSGYGRAWIKSGGIVDASA